MSDTEHIFKYKLDFSYQQTLLYLFTLVLYAGIRGSYVEGQFSFVFHDPLVYIITLFFAMALGTLVLNLWRERRLVIGTDQIIFHARHRQRVIAVTDIEWMHVGRERLVQTAGRFQLVFIKVKDRRRPFRIRVGRYERERELVAEMERIAARVPRRAHGRFLMPRER